MFFFKKKSKLAIDVGDASVEALMFENGSNARFYQREELLEGVIKDGGIVNQEQFILALKSLVKEFKKQVGGFGKKLVPAALNLPESRTFIYCFEIGLVAKSELEKTVRAEAKKMIPWPEEELYSDFIFKKTPETIRVVYVAAPKKLVDDYFAAFKSAGLKLIAVGAESLSLGRILLPTVGQSAVLILDLGARTANVSVFDKNNFLALSSSIPIAGEIFSADIARDKNVSLPEAEQLKKKTADILDLKNQGEYPSLWKSIDALAQEARKAIVYFENKRRQIIETVILSGGSSLLKEIDIVLADKLAKKVIIGDPLSKTKNLDKLNKDVAGIFFADVVGLAMGAKDKITMQVNLAKNTKPGPLVSEKISKPKIKKKLAVSVVSDDEADTAQVTREDINEAKKIKKQKIVLGIIVVGGLIAFGLAFWYQADHEQKKQAEIAARQTNFSVIQPFEITIPVAIDAQELTSDRASGRLFVDDFTMRAEEDEAAAFSKINAGRELKTDEKLWSEPVTVSSSVMSIVQDAVSEYKYSFAWLVYNEKEANALAQNRVSGELVKAGIKFAINNIEKIALRPSDNPGVYLLTVVVSVALEESTENILIQ